MILDIDKIKYLDESLQIDMDEQEMAEVIAGISELTKKIEELLKEDVEGIDPYFVSTTQTNLFAQTDDECLSYDDLSKLKNFKDGYFTIGQVIKND
ncbi:MAG: hypothetical protein ACRCUP_05750 [Mycoplasmatales bacterium]